MVTFILSKQGKNTKWSLSTPTLTLLWSCCKALTKLAAVTNFVTFLRRSIATPEDANSTLCPTQDHNLYHSHLTMFNYLKTKGKAV